MLNEIPQPLFPYLLEKKGRWLPPNLPRQAQLAQASRVASTWSNPLFSRTIKKGPSGPYFYLHPQFTKYTPFSCFWVTQWYLLSFWNIVKLHELLNDACLPLPECCKTLWITQQSLFGLPECCETLRITQQCLLCLPECCETLWIMKQSSLWLPECCETLWITQQIYFRLQERPHKVRKPTASVPGRN